MRTHDQNVAVGRKKQQAGSNFEAWVEVQHEKAILLGILAHVEKTEPHAKVVKGKLQFLEKGVADYVGVLCRDEARGHAGGRYLATEAKSTADKRLYKSVVSKKQRDHLNAVARAGGLALLVAEFRETGAPSSRFAVPWLDVPWAVAESAESVTADGLAGYAVDVECYLRKYHSGGRPVVPERRYPRE